jgi:hypothetical protein
MPQKSHIPLTDTLRLPDSVQAQAGALLSLVQVQTGRVVELLWPYLDTIGATEHQAWKTLITLAQKGDLPLFSPGIYIPDRVWRCILESAGRILRQHADRKRVLELLLSVLTAEILTDDQALQAPVLSLAYDEWGLCAQQLVQALLTGEANGVAREYALPERRWGCCTGCWIGCGSVPCKCPWRGRVSTGWSWLIRLTPSSPAAAAGPRLWRVLPDR